MLWELVQFPSFLQSLFDRSMFWWMFTAAFVLLAIFILIRGFYRARPATPTAA